MNKMDLKPKTSDYYHTVNGDARLHLSGFSSEEKVVLHMHRPKAYSRGVRRAHD